MNKEVSGEISFLDALNSRYCCLNEPLHQANDPRFLTSLRVYGTREDDEPQSPQTLSQHTIDPQILKKKITAALSAFIFRDPHVLVQFWLPDTIRKRCMLTNLDQPFGIGVVNEALYNYRLESEQRMFVVDGEHRDQEELGGSPGRVYRQKLPEWSLDNGYISLPVVDPASGCCVGVLELITSSKHADNVFEVKEISKALKEQDLKTSNAFEEPSFCPLPSEDRQIQIAKIKDTLIVMCDTHNLPLAQTWELSPLGSHVLHEKSIQKSCSSFKRRCIGKVCMSTAGLPFYVQDQSMWEFHEACMEQHLEKSRGVVGRALLSQGASYCENVTKLSEEEYPLVHNACKSGLGGCFAIFLHGVEGKNDYILEFFLPLDINDSMDSYVLNLGQKLKLKIEDASCFKMGDISSIEVIRPPSVVNNFSSNVNMQKTRDKIRNIKRKRDSLTMEAVEKLFGKPMDEAIKRFGGKSTDLYTGVSGILVFVTLFFITLFGLFSVSRSTFKRFLRDHSIPRWPMSKPSDRSACVTDSNQHSPVSEVTKESACNPYLASAMDRYSTLISSIIERLTRRIEEECRRMINELVSVLSTKLRSVTLSKSTTVVARGSFLSTPTLHVYHVAKLIMRLRCWKKRSLDRIAIAHQDVSLVFENTTNTEQDTNKNDPVVFNNSTYMEQAANNVDSLMDVDLDKATDLNFVDAIPRLSGADFIDDQGSFLKMAGCSSGSVLDYPMEPDGIETALAEMGKWLESDSPPPISSADMYLFGSNPSDYDFSDLVFDDQLF